MGYFKVIETKGAQKRIFSECLKLDDSSIELNDKTSELVKKDLLNGKTVFYNTIDGSISVDLNEKELEVYEKTALLYLANSIEHDNLDLDKTKKKHIKI